ncbi:MAG TPA: pirin family protein [Beijerinckiaceae bacterium]|nr:pirin family protein [Beijerinckiaceae bacterium]
MIHVRKSAERGHANFGWLDSYHSFSFGQYYDPQFMGFGPLRVINDDRVAGGGGFPMHPHDNMEIVTYMLSGSLAHKDSLGSGSTIRRGDVQRMTAGTGIRHSEFNASATDEAHFLQIWILPEVRGLAPSYEEKHLGDAGRRGRLQLIASRGARDGSVHINQDVDLYASILNEGEKLAHTFRPGRIGWLQVALGSVAVNGSELKQGDAVAMADMDAITIEGRSKGAEILLFDMAR